MTPVSLLRGFVVAAALAGLPVGQPLAAAPPPSVAAPVEPKVDARLAATLIGTWYADRIEDAGTLDIERSYFRDGTFKAVIGFHPAVDQVGTPEMVRPLRTAGKWRVEGDVLIEEIERISPPGADHPSTNRLSVQVESPERIVLRAAEDNAGGTPFRRKPITSAAHLRIYNQPRPDPGEPGDWQRYNETPITITYYDASTLERSGDFVAVWTRADLTPAGLDKSRQLAAELPASHQSLIMEHAYLRLLVDCPRRLIKAREARIHAAGRVVLNDFAGEDPLDWPRIRSYNDDNAKLLSRVCPAPTAP